MIIEIRTTEECPTADIREADNLRELSVAASAGASREEIQQALGSLGVPDGNALVWLAIAELKVRAAQGLPDSWANDFDSMINYAEENGWVSEDRNAVRAHVVFVGPESS